MSNNVTSYKKVIKILADPGIMDLAYRLLVQIAQEKPQVVVDAVRAFHNENENVKEEVRVRIWKDNVIKEVRQKGLGKIDAIKHLREISGLGLKDAKDLIESLDLSFPRL